VGEYFDVERLALALQHRAGQGYVYGQLPLIATKGVATAMGRDGYDELISSVAGCRRSSTSRRSSSCS
jgi:hypothetical protein